MPSEDQVVKVLQAHDPATEVRTFLEGVLFDATHSVYIGMVIFGLLSLLVLLLTPAKFPTAEE